MNIFAIKKRHFNPSLPVSPPIVERPILWLQKNGLEVEGIFRVSGSFHIVLELKKFLERGDNVNIDQYDAHSVAGALMQWLTELDDPLLTFDLFDKFISANSINDEAERQFMLAETISRLPPGNRVILHQLLSLLYLIHTKSSKNKMPSSSLAIVFGPSLLRSRQLSANITKHHFNSTFKIIENLILNYELIFLRLKQTHLLTRAGVLSHPNTYHGREPSPRRGFKDVFRKNCPAADAKKGSSTPNSPTTLTSSNDQNEKLPADDKMRVILPQDAPSLSSVMTVLHDPMVKTLFLEYLQQKEFSDENLLFYDFVEEYKELENDEERKEKLMFSLDEFVREEAPHAINVDGEMRSEVENAITGFVSEESTPLLPIFCGMQSFVMQIMSDHSYPRFLQSSFCRGYIKEFETNHRPEKGAPSSPSPPHRPL